MILRIKNHATPAVRWTRVARNTVAIFVIGLVGLFAPQTSYSYNRDTHQHIAELAYAYLKAFDLCEPIGLGDPSGEGACEERCEEEIRRAAAPGDLVEGYTCSCLLERCEEDCGDLGGFEKHVCVARCAQGGSGRSCLEEDPRGFCREPYYWEDEFGDEIIDSLCSERCDGGGDFVWAEECEAFSEIAGSDALTADDARRTVSFFQQLETTACPPRTYDYHGQDQCAGALTDAPRPLVELETAALAGSESEASYEPVVGGLLGATNTVTMDGTTKIDLTGTVLGYHAGVVDKLSDLHTHWRIVPVVEDFLKTGAEIAVGAGGGTLAGLAAAGGILACALSCPITIFFGTCDDCFDSIFDAVKDILDETGDIVETIEETDLISTSDGPTTLGENNTSMFHFMNLPPSLFDDLDGYRPLLGFGPGGVIVGGSWEGIGLDQLVDVRVSYPPSRRPLVNYQPSGPDDGLAGSLDRDVFYWHRLGIFDYTFPPIDNLSYYWWHKWLQGRLDGDLDTYGLLPLGGVLHGVQDITQPFHVWGLTLNGHRPYENRISETLDPASAGISSPGMGSSAPPLIIDLSDPGEERAFLERIGGYVERIYDEVIDPEEGVLHVRRLMHFLRNEVALADTDIKLSEDKPFLSWIDFDIEEEFIREVGMPAAVAASVVVLAEAARADLGPYEDQLALDLTDFEVKGPVPPVKSSDAPGSDPPLGTIEIPEGFDVEYPEWVCATAQPRSQDILDRYFTNQVNGRRLLSVLLGELLRCELTNLGLPVPSDAVLEEHGAYEARTLEAAAAWFSHGSLPTLEHDLACNNMAAPGSPFPPVQVARFTARCDGTLDSDGDGVFDQDDHCITPGALLTGGLTVGADGCAFTHEAVPESQVNPFLPGAIRARKP